MRRRDVAWMGANRPRRHSGATLAYFATRDLKAVAAGLGHTSTRMADPVDVEPRRRTMSPSTS